MERIEVQNMIDLARAQQDSMILPRLVKIEDRLIGIDGNGTGRDGAIQVLGKKVDGVSGKVDVLLEKDSQTKGALQTRQKYTGVIVSGLGTLAGLLGILLGAWIKHRMGW